MTTNPTPDRDDGPTDYIAEAICGHWGERCRTKDTDDFPDTPTVAFGRCLCCAAWEQYDNLMAEIARCFEIWRYRKT